MTPHIVTPEHAHAIAEWLRTRGGIAIWRSANLSNPGASWTTPFLSQNGQPMTKPTWESDSVPERVITSADEVVVRTYVEVRRFRVAVRRGSQGLTLKVTIAGTRRIIAAVMKAGEGAYYHFDYMTQEAIIYKPVSEVPLLDYLKSREEIS